jgi:predicted AlkP superfamily pyrophosphatase or phosphodiesterase
MITALASLLLAATAAAPPAARPSPVAAPSSLRPALVLALTIDQFRYDYLTRFRSEYTAGLRRLLDRGAVFTRARYQHFPTVTAIGHSTYMSGALPAVSGIIGNDWYDRAAARTVTSVSDPAEKIVGGTGGTGEGASPRRMLVSTVGDELKIATGSRSKVIGLSLKDRSAILPAGHMADLALWYDAQTGRFVTSSFYAAALPDWVARFDEERKADAYLGTSWKGGVLPREAGPAYYGAVYGSPFGNDVLEALAERAVEAERLGQRGETDLLALSFSSNDAVGHEKGPDSPEVHDVSVRTDQALGRLFSLLEARIGMRNVLVVLTADHGVAPLPETDAARRMPGGRLAPGAVRDAVQAALGQRFGEGQWIVSTSDHSLYLDRKLVAAKKLDLDAVQDAARAAAEGLPHVLRAYTLHELLAGTATADPVGGPVARSVQAQRTADVQVLLEPYWMFGTKGTTHGSVYGYDTHVPVIFMGPGIRPGLYRREITVNDVAPTLAEILGVETPSGAAGRVLDEVLALR